MYHGVEGKTLEVSGIPHTSIVFKCPTVRSMSR